MANGLENECGCGLNQAGRFYERKVDGLEKRKGEMTERVIEIETR